MNEYGNGDADWLVVRSSASRGGVVGEAWSTRGEEGAGDVTDGDDKFIMWCHSFHIHTSLFSLHTHTHTYTHAEGRGGAMNGCALVLTVFSTGRRDARVITRRLTLTVTFASMAAVISAIRLCVCHSSWSVCSWEPWQRSWMAIHSFVSWRIRIGLHRVSKIRIELSPICKFKLNSNGIPPNPISNVQIQVELNRIKIQIEFNKFAHFNSIQFN